MADPTKLDFADWFSVVATAIVSGVAGAMAFFRQSNAKRDARSEQVRVEMAEWDKQQATHTTQLAVLTNCQENTSEALTEIKATTRDTNEALKELSTTLTQALLSIQEKR